MVRLWGRVRSVAGQVFVLQVVVVLLLGAGAVAALVLQANHDTQLEAENRSRAVAQTFANSPGIRRALASPDPSAQLQPLTEAARKVSGVDFIVVTDTDGIRYTHPKPDRIGKKFVGDIAPVLRGHYVVERVNGTIGPLVQATVPVLDAHGKVVGIVSAGITLSKVRGVVDHQLPVLLGAAAACLALATAGTAAVSSRLLRQTRGLGPQEITRMYEHHDAVLHAVREGVLIVAGEDGDGERRLLLANDEARRLLELPADAEGRPVTALGLNPQATELLASGRVATDEVLMVGGRLLAVNNRPTDRDGGPPGSVATLRDSTELRVVSGRAETAQTRLRLLYDAGLEIGTTLDVVTTAEELARVAVPRLADFVTVGLLEPVLRGEEPRAGDGARLRRVAVRGIRDDHPLYPRGRLIAWAPGTPQGRAFDSGNAVLVPELHAAANWHGQDPVRTRRVMDYGIHSLMTVPLQARGMLLGMVNFWRSEKPEAFEEEDLSLAEELVARAAVCIDNARRYTREHAMAVTLQRSLLPRGLPDQSALDVAHRYLPAQAGVGGDWFDVIPLPGARVALVVGDVVGHGLLAAATMGRLRTAVHNFSTLDLPPDALLGHLDELVGRLDQDEAGPAVAADGAGDEDGGVPAAGHTGGGAAPPGLTVAGATCLYAIYDPVSGHCALSRAGHPLAALVRPDGSVEFPDVPAGPPLGVGGLPFETAELDLPEGSLLVLYTDGLVESRHRDIDVGLGMLRAALSGHPGRSPEDTCVAVLEALLPDRPGDDIALLVARTRRLDADHIAMWDVPADPSAVGRARSLVSRRLADWGLDELAFTTELILSELVTNAIRYATGPIGVRLLLDRTLVCEVSDSSSTTPYLRYAATTDEGGRGLFLVAQFAEHWGTRYTPEGKVIWAEQQLPGPLTPRD